MNNKEAKHHSWPDECLNCEWPMDSVKCKKCGANYGRFGDAVKQKSSLKLPLVREALPNHVNKDRRVKE